MTTAATTKTKLEYVEAGSRRNPSPIGSQPGPTSAQTDDSDAITGPMIKG